MPILRSLSLALGGRRGLQVAALVTFVALGGGCDRDEATTGAAGASDSDTSAASATDSPGTVTSGSTTTVDTSDEPGGATSAPATTTGADTEAPAPGSVAAECVAAGATPFSSAACGEAMRAHCLQFADRDACVGDRGLAAAGDGVYRCGWFRVVAYDAACTPGSESFRCEAGEVLADDAGCRSQCPPNGIYGPTAWPATGELLVAASDGACVTGPIGPWSALASQGPARDPDDPSRCGGAETLPPAPALCDCADAFCAAP